MLTHQIQMSLNQEKLAQNIERSMAADQADGRVGAAGLCVMQNGKQVYKRYFGKKSYATGDEMDADGDRVLFRLASMTKPITTVAALIQVDRGLLSLDQPISDILPAFAEMNLGGFIGGHTLVHMGKAKTPLTLRMLLNHTNGLGSMEVGDVQFAQMSAEDRHDLAHVTDFLSHTALSFEPATYQFYSATAAFDVAARMVELTSDMPFNAFVQKNIFAPCGMTDTTFTPTDHQWSRMVTMHERVEGAEGAPGHSQDASTCPGCVFEDFPTTWFSGGAGLAATLPDYVRFAEMLCRGGLAQDGTRVLSEQMVRAMGTATVPEYIMPKPQQWGLGVRVITGDDYYIPRDCFGWSGAYGTHFWVDPTNQITAVYMKNSRYDGGAGSRTSIVFEQDVYGAMM